MLSDQELHQIAMNIVGKQLESNSYEFLGVNSKLGVDPQFVCTKDRKLYFVVVRAFCYPNDPLSPDTGLIKKVTEHSEKFEAVTYFAGVGVYHPDDSKLQVSKQSGYHLDFKGLYLASELL